MPTNKTSFYSNGKFLISAEYLVLRGATALACPLNKGQSLSVQQHEPDSVPLLKWTAKAPGRTWFEVHFQLPELNIVHTDDLPKAAKLQIILLTLKQLRPELFDAKTAYTVETQLDFEPEWGFGSSSTLIANLAKWASVNPYTLLNYSIGGSGYDIACAIADGPVYYTLDKLRPKVEKVHFAPAFADKLYFVYLGKKQDSSDGIRNFNKSVANRDLTELIAEVSEISQKMATTNDFKAFCKLADKHEKMLSGLLLLPPVKERFNDFDGSLKSLGAWGGDFALAIYEGNENRLKSYFSEKGLDTVFRFKELVL